MENLTQQANAWLHEFEKALATHDEDLFDSLFLEESQWRDLVAFTWNFRQFHDRDAIGRYVWTAVDDIKASNFKLDESLSAPAVAPVPLAPTETYEIHFTFDTAQGRADGLVNVLPDESSPVGLRAQLLLTRLTGINSREPQWPQFGRYNHDELVNERREQEARATYADHEPDVIIIGGGHNGSMTAVAMAKIGLDALIVDKNERVGDNWRKRYDSLVLHMPHGMMHFLGMEFPESFPDYISKDRLADWFESYARSFDLNFWTSTEFLSGAYNEDTKTWDAQLRLSDGSVRTMHPKYLVLATGGSGTPRIPDVPGLSDFAGDVRHTSKFNSGAEYTGKNVLVIGAGTSGHDVAYDVVNHGGTATLLQRGPVVVVNLTTANLNYGGYNPRIESTDVLDKRFMAGMTEPSMRAGFKMVTEMGNELDKEIHDGLEAAGFNLDRDPGGWFTKYFETAGGYYINVGASESIIRGDIAVRQYADIEKVVSNGLQLKTGEVVEYDAIVLATGYANQSNLLDRLFGPEVTEAVGPIYGFDAGGEVFKNAFRPIPGQPGLIIMDSGIAAGRWYGPMVALQIAADLDGVIPEAFKNPEHPSRTPIEQLVDS
ncbi:NAD(P)/FAD-dependent oxidoreductase [soil metagenome]